MNNKIYKIVKKGQENPPLTISRSNKYFLYFLTSLLLGDYDQDEAMPSYMIINTLDEFYSLLIKILPLGFNKVECLIGYGSSYGIKNSKGELVNSSNSFHAYWTNTNISEETVNNLIEYIKRACIYHQQYFLKIHKDGSASMRYALDLSVMKSALSRLCFEAKPTCKDGLYQDRPKSLISNMNSQESLDLSKVYYDHLPDWRPIYEQLKIEKQDLIQQTKRAYKTSKINELVSKGLTQDVATNIVVKQIKESVISVKTLVEVN
ncbi:hypothetical protein [Arcobacter sp. YIC-310]|uniref:hypothetical protein n=1 Tax=Arcobacter sp. YIC-310 TaxID=3376632 RepID=UPI003C17CAAB